MMNQTSYASRNSAQKKKTTGMRKVTHHTFSLSSPLASPEASGADGIPEVVGDVVRVERGDVVEVRVVCEEVSARVGLLGLEDVAGGEGVGVMEDSAGFVNDTELDSSGGEMLLSIVEVISTDVIGDCVDRMTDDDHEAVDGKVLEKLRVIDGVVVTRTIDVTGVALVAGDVASLLGGGVARDNGDVVVSGSTVVDDCEIFGEVTTIV